jgi:small basic protein
MKKEINETEKRKIYVFAIMFNIIIDIALAIVGFLIASWVGLIIAIVLGYIINQFMVRFVATLFT